MGLCFSSRMRKEDRAHIKQQVEQRYRAILPCLNEKSKRIWAASESLTIGWGGDSIVNEVTGLSRVTIQHGKRDIKNFCDQTTKHNERIRECGGGRHKLSKEHPEILEVLDSLIDPFSRGDPESPLRWTCKSVRNLSNELISKGYQVSPRTVCSLLDELNYSLQSNRKKLEGKQHPDRDDQFIYINDLVKKYLGLNLPVVSVDAKKRENIGNFANKGLEWEKKKHPKEVNTYDFPDKDKGKASIYGIYDVRQDNGWINVGISKNTAEFAVESIRRWWWGMGIQRYPNAEKILITADGGGSNGYRIRLWKSQIQRLANETGLKIQICHFPPSTSKWNKIEHSMFSFVSKNWRGRPLESIATIVNCIANTKTTKGLKIKTSIDKHHYEGGIKVSDKEMEKINMKKNNFHGEWNYQILPVQ